MNEQALREELVRWGRSIFDRGLTAGSSGNISVRCGADFLATPTNSCLGFLDASTISKVDASGKLLAGAPPTKELPLHFAFYQARPKTEAIVHLHSTYATAISCLAETDPENAIPPITPYAVMRFGRVPVIRYFRPGSSEVAPEIAARAAEHNAVLLANHGPVVAGPSLEAAVFAMEELEESARLAFVTHGMKVRRLDEAAIAELNATFNLR